ncbi:MAG: FG-GAP-like repeat-containing protein, partial [Alphaproteobacteria bacterium]|nr:FG-GAP-like repeat-containing protein [Alphaproteobacteria bacterium]
MIVAQVIDTATGEAVIEYPVPPTEVISLEPGQRVVLPDILYGDPAAPQVIIEIIDGQHVQIILEDGTPLLIENLYALLEEGEDVGLVFVDSGQTYGAGAHAVEVPIFASLDAFTATAAGPGASSPGAATGTGGRGNDGAIDPPDLNLPHLRAVGVEADIPRPAFAPEGEIRPDIPELEGVPFLDTGAPDLDLFIVNFNEPNQILTNDGDGNFTAADAPDGARNSQGVALGDLDGDGDLDIFVANSGQPNQILTNDGNRNFTAADAPGGAHDSRDVALGDLDGDG